MPDQIAVEVWMNDKYYPLHSPTWRGSDLLDWSSTDASKTIKVSARTVSFKKQYLEWDRDEDDPPSSPPHAWYLLIRINRTTTVAIRPIWDKSKTLVGDVKSGMCIVFENMNQTRLLVFDAYGGYYERCGYFDSWQIGNSRETCRAFTIDCGAASPLRRENFRSKVPLLQIAKLQTSLLR